MASSPVELESKLLVKSLVALLQESHVTPTETPLFTEFSTMAHVHVELDSLLVEGLVAMSAPKETGRCEPQSWDILVKHGHSGTLPQKAT